MVTFRAYFRNVDGRRTPNSRNHIIVTSPEKKAPIIGNSTVCSIKFNKARSAVTQWPVEKPAMRKVLPCYDAIIMKWNPGKMSQKDLMTSSNGNFFALLAIYAGNVQVTGEFPSQRLVTRRFDVFFIGAWINAWVNSREAGDLRRHRTHYDAIVAVGKPHYQYISLAPFTV